MPHRRYKYTSVRDIITTLPIIYEHSTMIGKSTIAVPRQSSEQAVTKTSKARAVRSNATSWAQDDEDDDYMLIQEPAKYDEGDDYVLIEKPAKEEKTSMFKAVKLLKKAVKKAKNVGGKGKSKVDTFEAHTFDSDAPTFEEMTDATIAAGCENDPFGDENEVESAEIVGSAGRGVRG
jgi:hypothetical protein